MAAATQNILPVATIADAVAGSTGNTHAPASNTAAVVTKAAAGAGVSNVIDGIAWSYDAAPTNGGLTITDGGSTVFQVAVTAAGPGFFLFPRPLKSAANSALVVTLAAGGSGVTGKVNVLGARTE